MSKTVKIRRDTVEALLHYITANGYASRGVLDELRLALVEKPRTPARKAREAKVRREKRSKREETSVIYREVATRAAGRCECCHFPFGPLDPPEMDHFRGRGRVRQTIENCWMLRRSCHKAKNLPSRGVWLRAWMLHCLKHGYEREVRLAEDELASLADVERAAEITGCAR